MLLNYSNNLLNSQDIYVNALSNDLIEFCIPAVYILHILHCLDYFNQLK